jgi:hypothetical protein
MDMLKYKVYIVIIFIASILSANEIQEIRKNYSFIQNNLENFIEIEEENIVDSNLSEMVFEAKNHLLLIASMNRFYYKNKIKKINILLESWTYKGKSEYFYINNKLFFVYKVRKHFLRLKDGTLNRNKYITQEHRYYFNNNKMVKYLVNKEKIKKGIQYFKEEESEILHDAKIYKNF